MKIGVTDMEMVPKVGVERPLSSAMTDWIGSQVVYHLQPQSANGGRSKVPAKLMSIPTVIDSIVYCSFFLLKK
jgi:hypothetical protein